MHTIRFRLRLSHEQQRIANERFYMMWRVHNVIAKHARHLVHSLEHDRQWKAARRGYSTAKANGDVTLAARYGKEMNNIRSNIGLTKSGLESYAKVQYKKYKKHLSSQQVQKEADRIYAAVEDYLFGDGKAIHIKKLEDFHTISSKSQNGCHYADPLHPSEHSKDEIIYPQGQITWMGETMKVDIPWHDWYTSFSLDHPLSYCEIKRIPFKNGWHYYVILYLEGEAPIKFLPGDGTAGIDPGVSTMCATSDVAIHFDELAPKCKDYDKAIADTQLRIDRSRRIHDPQNFNPDGTVRRGRHKWHDTNACKSLKWRLRTLYRQKSDYTRTEHGRVINQYLRESRHFIVEDMDYQALAKRSRKPAERQDKATVITDKDGIIKTIYKFRKKRRYGKSVNVLEKKVTRFNGTYELTDNKALRASQYRHDTDTYEKVQLSQRTKVVDGHIVYRDPYSSYLIRYSNDEHNAPDREACIQHFDDFLKFQEVMIRTVTIQYPARPACFGF